MGATCRGANHSPLHFFQHSPNSGHQGFPHSLSSPLPSSSLLHLWDRMGWNYLLFPSGFYRATTPGPELYAECLHNLPHRAGDIVARSPSPVHPEGTNLATVGAEREKGIWQSCPSKPPSLTGLQRIQILPTPSLPFRIVTQGH